MKIIMLSDIHGPMTDEQKKLYEDAAKNTTLMLRGDMIDCGGPVNQDILKHIPVKSFQEVFAEMQLLLHSDWKQTPFASKRR